MVVDVLFTFSFRYCNVKKYVQTLLVPAESLAYVLIRLLP